MHQAHARRALLAFDTGEALIGALGVRFGLLLLGSVWNGALFVPFLFRGLQDALPPVSTAGWAVLMIFWGCWALVGVCAGVRSDGRAFSLRRGAMMCGFLLWLAVAFALIRTGQPADAWLTYPLLSLSAFVKYLRLCAREKMEREGGRRRHD